MHVHIDMYRHKLTPSWKSSAHKNTDFRSYILVNGQKLVGIYSNQDCARIGVNFISSIAHKQVLVDAPDINIRDVCHIGNAVRGAQT